MFAIAILTIIAVPALAQEPATDSIQNNLKVKELAIKQNYFKARIATEDKKRNQKINGVTPETEEMINDKQDSICLDLRSQLVAVELELKELSSASTIPYNQMSQQPNKETDKRYLKKEETDNK